MLKVGLTGGIGSGKTVVSDAFTSHGTPIIDTDIIAREVLSREKGLLDQLSTTFGSDILDDQRVGHLPTASFGKSASWGRLSRKISIWLTTS